MNIRKCTKWTCWTGIYATIVLFLIVSGIFLWLVTGERNIPFFKETINSITQSLLPGYKVQVKQHYLTWDGRQNAFHLKATNIQISNASNKEVAFIPEASVGFDMLHILYGNLVPNKLHIYDPEIRLPHPIPTHLPTSDTLTDSSNALYPHVVKLMSLLGATQRQNVALKRMHVSNANVIVSTAENKQFTWHIAQASGKVVSTAHDTSLQLQINSHIDTIPIPLNATLTLSDNQSAQLKTQFQQLHLTPIIDYIPDTLLQHSILKTSDLTMSGWFAMNFNHDGVIQLTELAIDKAHGTLSAPDYLAYDMPIHFMQFKGSISDDYSLLNVEQCDIDFDGPRLKFSGTAKLDPLNGMIGADFTLHNLPVNQVEHVWPLPVIPYTRHWITTHIREGMVTSAKGKVNLYMHEIMTGNLSKEAIDITLDVDNTTILYHPEFPLITHANARAHFSGHGVGIDVIQARSGAIELAKPGHVDIPSYKNNHVMMHIKGEAKSNAVALVDMYKRAIKREPMFLQAPLMSAKGNAHSNFSISVPLASREDAPPLQFTLESKLENITLDKLLGRGALSQGTLSLLLDNNKVSIEGNGLINTIPTSIKFTKELDNLKDKPNTSKYSFKSHISNAELSRLGLPNIPFIKDKFILAAAIEEQANQTVMRLHGNFTEADINIPYIQWHKLNGVSATFDAQATLYPSNIFQVNRFSFHSKSLNSIGSANFSIDNTQKHTIFIDSFAIGETNINGELGISDKGYTLQLKGPSLDIRSIPLLDNINTEQGNKHISIQAQLGKVITQNNGQFFNVTGHIHCVTSGCFSASLDTVLNQGHFLNVSYQPNGANQQRLHISSDNAGEVLRVFGVMQHIKGGDLEINSTMLLDAENPQEKTLEGVMTLHDFYAIKTPVLAKLITLASFQGVLDLLDGSGIPFKKFSIPFKKKDSQFTIEKAKGHGDSIGLTIRSATVNTAQKTINLKGTIVPSYTVNNFLSRVLKPIGGDALTSGDGQGILGTDYSISGPMDNPQITINPLSTITPGFIKSIFDITEAPAVKAKEPIAPASEQLAP